MVQVEAKRFGSVVAEGEGGGGFGRPQARSAEAIKADIASGLVSPEAAEHDYGFAS